ncbi:hypothetical protein [Bifidobacterium aerophilum]|uniref:hypothetical protein n=1 Tax=Bifidobacterium aerophilum TaxID=1798155 RepID=UPI0013D155AC|nr:hypothetical protein [Bifidobacterium aerophilum]
MTAGVAAAMPSARELQIIRMLADGDPAGETAMLRDHFHGVAGRLEALGFATDVALSDSLPQRYDVEAVNVLRDLIDETGNNIAKHARPHADCAIRITLDDRQATLAALNRVRTGSGNFNGSLDFGTVLRTKAEHIRRIGGTLDHTVHGTTWTLSARLPLHS